MFDYAKLRGRIREIFNRESDFADNMGVSKATMSAKLNGRIEFSQKEIYKAMELLNIDACEIDKYFFTLKVQ